LCYKAVKGDTTAQQQLIQYQEAWQIWLRDHPPISSLSKTCSRCHQDKPLIAFAHHAACRDGLHTICKKCVNCASSAWYAANRERHYANGHTWRMTNPERVRVITHAWRRAHPEKTRVYKRNWEKANPEKLRAIERTHAARRRARKASVPVNDLTTEQFAEICKAFTQRCAYCGQKSKILTIDHVTPYKFNGSNTLWNVVPACRSCNSKKNAGAVLKPVQPLLLTLAPAKMKRKKK
jgi:5-methylcytosine-specific restriction endonuclease McrA